MTDQEKDIKRTIESLLEDHGLSLDTRLYRQTLPEYLTRSDGPSGTRISANAEPTESVLNIYEGGYNTAAYHLGAGLSFVESKASDWHEPSRVCVELTIKDVISQGGRIYPVTSIITERTWYVTLPEGSVAIRRVD